jgi:hypothetical protein
VILLFQVTTKFRKLQKAIQELKLHQSTRKVDDIGTPKAKQMLDASFLRDAAGMSFLATAKTKGQFFKIFSAPCKASSFPSSKLCLLYIVYLTQSTDRFQWPLNNFGVGHFALEAYLVLGRPMC